MWVNVKLVYDNFRINSGHIRCRPRKILDVVFQKLYYFFFFFFGHSAPNFDFLIKELRIYYYLFILFHRTIYNLQNLSPNVLAYHLVCRLLYTSRYLNHSDFHRRRTLFHGPLLGRYLEIKKILGTAFDTSHSVLGEELHPLIRH